MVEGDGKGRGWWPRGCGHRKELVSTSGGDSTRSVGRRGIWLPALCQGPRQPQRTPQGRPRRAPRVVGGGPPFVSGLPRASPICPVGPRGQVRKRREETLAVRCLRPSEVGEWPLFSSPPWSRDRIPRGSWPVNGHLSAQMDQGLACEGGDCSSGLCL